MSAETSQPPGPGVDAQGRAVIDPTANVLATVEAAVQRLDDLRTAEARRVDEIMTIVRIYDDKLRDAEAKRIDAIRTVDVLNVQRAAEVAAAQAQTLANQVTVSADTLRNQVQAAATASTVALAAALDPIQKDIADLRRAQYEAQGGKNQVVESRGVTGTQLAIGGFIITLALALVAVIPLLAR